MYIIIDRDSFPLSAANVRSMADCVRHSGGRLHCGRAHLSLLWHGRTAALEQSAGAQEGRPGGRGRGGGAVAEQINPKSLIVVTIRDNINAHIHRIDGGPGARLPGQLDGWRALKLHASKEETIASHRP